jgi:hypothetical protein
VISAFCLSFLFPFVFATSTIEALPTFFVNALLAGFIFPYASFWCMVVFFIGRVVYALRYTSAADDRMAGALIGMLAIACLDAMVLMVVLEVLM